jgi:serine/threonine protein kinase
MKLERMPKDQLKFIQEVLNEAKMMRDMQHERIVQFIGFDFREISIIMELMPRGALSSFIKENKNTMNWSTRYQMMLDICEGMAYLHSAIDADGSEKKVLFHQDLKSANILLAEYEGSIRAKIGDFGLSRKSNPSNRLNLVMKKTIDVESDEVKLIGGTECYQASVSS